MCRVTAESDQAVVTAHNGLTQRGHPRPYGNTPGDKPGVFRAAGRFLVSVAVVMAVAVLFLAYFLDKRRLECGNHARSSTAVTAFTTNAGRGIPARRAGLLCV